MAVVLKTRREIEFMREAGRISAMALKLAGEAVRPGVSTFEIDRIARNYIESQLLTFSDFTVFLLLHAFP